MKQYDITGMSCAACAARIEKGVSSVAGVEACSVSLLTNSMSVEGEASDEAVVKAVENAGYGAVPKGRERTEKTADPFADRETPAIKKRLFVSIIFLLALMYFSMGRSMFSLPVPAFLENSPSALGSVQMLLAAAVLLINKKFFVSGAKGVLHRAPNMDTLVSLGSGISFLWSVFALVMTFTADNAEKASEWAGKFYFESAAMILVLITVGKLLEAKSKGKTTDAIRSLMNLTPETAVLVKNGEEITVPAAQVKKDDIFLVRPGGSVPADGVILEGSAALNEAPLTGESLPAEKKAGDPVFAATVDQNGFIKCRATGVGEDTALAKIIKLVEDAAATKAPAARLADKVSGVFVPTVVCIALVTLIVWLVTGKPFDYALERAVSVLVISCPCALGLATPVAIMVGSGVGAKNGILFKTARSLEESGKIQIAVLDKTGTLTKGAPEITDILPAPGVSEEELLSAAFSLESKSEHPLARAVVNEAKKRGLSLTELSGFRALPGSGVMGEKDGKKLLGGSVGFISSIIPLTEEIQKNAASLADDGKTPLVFAEDQKILGILAAADTLKADSAEAVGELIKTGIRVVMLTGDNVRTAKAIARQAGIRHIVAGVKPDGKNEVIRRLCALGKTAMLGDGINDAPALTSADTGIAVGAGTDVAIDSANVVLMRDSLLCAADAVKLSRATRRNIRENLFWAFFYNVVCIPLAAGCYVSAFGWTLNPMIGAAAMSLSSVCVVTNALRLNLFKPRKAKAAKIKAPVDEEALVGLIEKINETLKEESKMIKTMKIEGMMCPHCEAHTKKALEELDGVESATASFKEGTAVVTLTKDVDDGVLKAAVEAAGYTVLGVE